MQDAEEGAQADQGPVLVAEYLCAFAPFTLPSVACRSSLRSVVCRSAWREGQASADTINNASVMLGFLVTRQCRGTSRSYMCMS